MNLMPIENISDWEERLARQDAFWHREILDRPVVSMSIPRKEARHPYPPKKQWSQPRERWLDSEYIAELAAARVANTEYLGDALPAVWPNLGPDVFSAFLGTPLEFGHDTSWSSPICDSLDEVASLAFSEDNFYWQKLLEMTDALLEVGKGKFYTGISDLHVGGDAIAALRGPFGLSLDLAERSSDVCRLLEKITQIFFQVMDFFYDKLSQSGQACSCWFSIVSRCKWYVPSNDYSCMISAEMFDEVFLPGITQECRHLDASIYHLDGPGALQHLDSILQIPELNAVQWVWGAGNGMASDWLHIFKRCQDAGKGVWLGIEARELDLIMEHLRPEGAFLHVSGIADKEHADAVLRKVSAWR